MTIVDQDLAKLALCFGLRIISMIIASAKIDPAFHRRIWH